MKEYPTQEFLRENYDYDVGRLIDKITQGDYASGKSSLTYPILRIDNRVLLLHRLIWIYFNGDISDSLVIDHINGRVYDSRIENLRMCTISHNSMNTKAQRIGKIPGVKKISEYKFTSRYRNMSLEIYESEADAYTAYRNYYHDINYQYPLNDSRWCYKLNIPTDLAGKIDNDF